MRDLTNELARAAGTVSAMLASAAAAGLPMIAGFRTEPTVPDLTVHLQMSVGNLGSDGESWAGIEQWALYLNGSAALGDPRVSAVGYPRQVYRDARAIGRVAGFRFVVWTQLARDFHPETDCAPSMAEDLVRQDVEATLPHLGGVPR